MKRIVIHRGMPVVEDAPAATAAGCGEVLVDVAFSMISPGTELHVLDQAARGVLWRVRHEEHLVRRAWLKMRREGMARTWSAARGDAATALPLGYSCAGIVREAGEGITDLSPGTRVACVEMRVAPHAEVVCVPRHLAVPIPAAVPLRAAASTALGGIALHAVRRAEARLGENVAVIGLGVIGQLTVQLLAAAGCHVIAVDPVSARVERTAPFTERGVVAPAHEAVTAVQDFAGAAGIDSVLVATHQVDGVLQAASEMVRPKGRLVIVGMMDLALAREPAWIKELDVVVSRTFGPGWGDDSYVHGGLDYPLPYVRWTANRNLEEYLRQLAAGRVNPEALIDREVTIDQAPDAYRSLRQDRPPPIGVVIRYPFAAQAT